MSFIPTLGTMLLGLRAANGSACSAPKIPMRNSSSRACYSCSPASLLHFTGICPIVKRIWTPAWTLFSGGVCFFFLAAFSWVIDVKGYRSWAFPLVVVGMNSIAAYLIAHLWEDFIESSFRINSGASALNILGSAVEPTVLGSLALGVYWLILYWMYRNKIFIRI